MPLTKSEHSAAEQGLGYTFQSRFALLKALDLPEEDALFIERNDDVEFVGTNGSLSLASLKHKAIGDKLTDLSVDFWKSVRIWLKHYNASGRTASRARFLLFHTGTVASGSFLSLFEEDSSDDIARAAAAAEAIARTENKDLIALKGALDSLDSNEARDFYGRITIFTSTPRITDIPALVDKRLRTVRREVRRPLFERLEGWWTNAVIDLLTGTRSEPLGVQEVSDKLAAFAEEYRMDNLPINYRDSRPSGQIDALQDPRMFVRQLRTLELSENRIQFAIIDYYRAFEQRSSWARENLLISGEIEEYEDRLVEEWARYKEICFENLASDSAEAALLSAGRELLRWAERDTGHLRIRERVTEAYVVRGVFQILANASPSPRVHWHPRFLERLAEILGVAA
ncbi:hypothetical protein I0J99_23980 (plasmid) [Sinorhizobium meliloti]|uniref:ABC-three component system protein n=1 Tax=Rhizobium meliloti TaxID=382 RepID=UPI000FD774B5|nr:ABC-three component system protein [Sinorhizobium meliloti]MDX1115859.1 hypothetical protein [Sinorhizobium medicae]QPI27872.1 hypothetical protein I0J99_23980 [Sinorhizobium meliloti]RVK61773.1 hypothetical protein CN155_02680 [Sinorhizobium meliloti]